MIHDPERELARCEGLLRLEQELWTGQLRRAALGEIYCQIADAIGVPPAAGVEAGEEDESEAIDASADRFAATFDPAATVERNPFDARRSAAWFAETFTPERTARRVARAVLGRYRGSADCLDSREAFLERTLPAVEHGISRARRAGSSLSEEIRAELEETFLRIRDLLQVFGFGGGIASGRQAA